MPNEDKFALEEIELALLKGALVQLLKSHLIKMSPAELRSTAALFFAIDRLPIITPGLDLVFTISQPNIDGNYGWVSIGFSEEEFRLGIGEHFYDPRIGGDTETKTIFETYNGSDNAIGDVELWLEYATARCQDGSVRVDHDETDYDSLDWFTNDDDRS